MKTHLKFLTHHHWPPRSVIPNINSRFSFYSSLLPALQTTCPWSSVCISDSFCGLELPQIPWHLEHLEATYKFCLCCGPHACVRSRGVWSVLDCGWDYQEQCQALFSEPHDSVLMSLHKRGAPSQLRTVNTNPWDFSFQFMYTVLDSRLGKDGKDTIDKNSP